MKYTHIAAQDKLRLKMQDASMYENAGCWHENPPLKLLRKRLGAAKQLAQFAVDLVEAINLQIEDRERA